jgi:hypothetical protein
MRTFKSVDELVYAFKSEHLDVFLSARPADGIFDHLAELAAALQEDLRRRQIPESEWYEEEDQEELRTCARKRLALEAELTRRGVPREQWYTDEGEEPPSAIKGLAWFEGPRFSAEAHSKNECDDGCRGQSCQYNTLCAGCDTLLHARQGIFCLERKGRQITTCDGCFYDSRDAMLQEGGWFVDGEELEEEEEEEGGGG